MVNKILIKQAVLAMQANQRQSTSHTKTRGEVSGGGKKPWKQKGTGRARVGSSRSPIWVGGGVTFGPSNKQNFKQVLPKRMAKIAKEQLWQLFKIENRVLSVPKLHLAEPKTKLAVKMLSEVNPKGKTLLVTKSIEPELILAISNIPNTDVKPLDQVSILDLAFYKTLVMEKDCFDQIYGKSSLAKKSTKATAKKEITEVVS
ncbi:MAG: 50S ribosomal protein L4 [Candidatus Berkelbacteria bacterium]|nr:50S ribosomal protein L4 [Candidatus Berkelbacteria bacterium]MCR4307594.1 50S ribosomal protein L4 [Candidatus Berkelbacteria bacterium]